MVFKFLPHTLSAALLLSACHETKPGSVEKPKQAVARPTPAPVVTAPVPPPVQVEEESSPADLLGLEDFHRGEVDHLSRAREMKSLGDFEGAIVELRRALHHQPSDEEAVTHLIRLAALTNEKPLWANALERMASFYPDDTSWWVKKARVELGMGKAGEAMRTLEMALRVQPDEPEALHVLGRVYLSEGKLSAAIDQFEQVIALSPYHGYALNNLGFAYLRANENEKALTVLTQAAELLPAIAYIQNNLGVALERAGRIEEARLAFNEAEMLSPKYVKARLNSQRVAKAQTSPSEQEPAFEGDTVDSTLETEVE